MNRPLLLPSFLAILCLFAIADYSYAACTFTSPGQISGAQIICSGESPARLTNLTLPTSDDAGDTFEYLWMKSTTAPGSGTTVWAVIPGSTDMFYDPQPLTETTYFRRCVRIAGCGSAYPEESNIIEVTVVDRPTAQIKSAPGSTQVNTDTDFQATPVMSATGTVSYEWTFEDGIPVTASTQNVNDVQFTSTGMKTVTLTVRIDYGGGIICSATVSYQINVTVVLPVEMTYFDATLSNREVMLKWQTTSELNNELFVVEHSTDGRDFLAIDEIEGMGTTETTTNYTAIDQQPVTGLNYYRLVQIDFDGAETTSEVVVVEYKLNDTPIAVVPNPAQHEFQLQSPALDRTAQWQVIDLTTGRLVDAFQQTANSQFTSVDVSALTSGTYLLRSDSGQTARFVKL